MSAKDPIVPEIIIYHAQCPDGSCAAMVAREYVLKGCLPGGKDDHKRAPCMMPMLYTKDPEADSLGNVRVGSHYFSVRGKRVLIVDFSFPRNVLEKMHDGADSLIVLDHHKTAAADLAGLSYCVFDMQRSGARLAWDYFHPGKPSPWVVDYVEDRDLWKHALMLSKEVNCFLSTLPFNDFDAWARMMDLPRSHASGSGAAMLIFKEADIRRMKERSVMAQLAGYVVPVAAAPVHESEVAGELCIECNTPFAAAFYQRPDGLYSYSLRSRSDFDVSAIARMYGGGGHQQAAGFAVSHPVHAPIKRG